MEKTKNCIKWVDSRDKGYIILLVLWLFRHAERFGLKPRNRKEILAFFNSDSYSLDGSANLIVADPMPKRSIYDGLLAERQRRDRERDAAGTPEPTQEERAQMDALLAKFPNLIQRRQSAPTLFNY